MSVTTFCSSWPSSSGSSIRFNWFESIKGISIYTLSDLGDLSNLIGSLSRTIQQYSPPSEWIMCRLGVFPIFFTKRSFKSWQNPRVNFFLGKRPGNRSTKGQLKVAFAVPTFSTSFSMILTSLYVIMTRYLSTLMIRKLLLLYGRR